MRKDDIILELSKKLLDKKQASAALETLTGAIKKGLKKDGKVVISGFGSFNLVRSRAVVRHNPKTLEKVNVPAKLKVRFKPSPDILD